jgi:hypothetical protein
MRSPVIRAPKVSRDKEPEFFTIALVPNVTVSSFPLDSTALGSPRFSIHSQGRLTTGVT